MENFKLVDDQHKPKTYFFLGCNGCHRTDVTLVKCTDSYYCPKCMKELNKIKFTKGKK